VLAGVSYRAVLERGFALVEGSDRRVRRRAASIGAGERLALKFADGTVGAISQDTAEKPKAPAKLPARGQGSLF
jgi:exodeoxyribonuclease VII large subunit